MVKIADATFKGKSGTPYQFEVFPIDTAFNPIEAVYIFTERTVNNGVGSHRFIYIGEALDLQNRISGHEKFVPAKMEGANCICVMRTSGQHYRQNAETDLIRANNTPLNLQ